MLLRGSSASCGVCGDNRNKGVITTMRDYVDMFVCLLGYLTVVAILGAIIGWVVSL